MFHVSYAYTRPSIPSHRLLLLLLQVAVYETVRRYGFWAILAAASIPNPLFDLAGLTCGHFGIPFWTFFGATLIGKAVFKVGVCSSRC